MSMRPVELGASSGPMALIVGSLAATVEPWPGDLAAVEAEGRFQQQSISAALVAVGPPAGVAVLTRTQVHLKMTGPRGYGRSLHSRSPVTSLLGPCSLVLPAEMSVIDAAQEALQRPIEARYDDIAVRWADGRLGLLSVSTLMEELAREFATVALHDPLTRLPNRAALRHRIERCVEERRQYGVMVLDLDGFKHVNDMYGHHAGDEVLIETAARLRAVVGGDDLVVRLGGDEFVILATRDASPASVAALAALILRRLSEPVTITAGMAERLGASIGVVVVRPGDTDGGAALRAADEALYEAKRAGKGCVRWGHTTGPLARLGHRRAGVSPNLCPGA
jgi:diguanylate cyclase (GGDEF)-like protein